MTNDRKKTELDNSYFVSIFHIKGNNLPNWKGLNPQVTEDEVNVDTTNADSSQVLNRTSQHTFVERMDKQSGI